MEILALYSSPDALTTALAAGARHLAAAVDGFALVYQFHSKSDEPDGWAGFTCAKDAAAAGVALENFRRETTASERPLRCEAPAEPQRIWSRATGGIYGFPLRHDGQARGLAIVGIGYLLHRKEQVNADLMSLTRPNGWIGGVLCIAFGIMLSVAYISILMD